jgi:hypothetical protein
MMFFFTNLHVYTVEVSVFIAEIAEYIYSENVYVGYCVLALYVPPTHATQGLIAGLGGGGRGEGGGSEVPRYN